MKTNYFLGLFAMVGFLFLGTIQSSAVDYVISFTGSGANTTVESVEVKNLTQGTSVEIPSGSSLHLVDWANSINQFGDINEGIHVFSNSIDGKSSVSFYAKQEGATQISVFSVDGRKIAGKTQVLREGINSFDLSVPQGVYFVNVQGVGFEYSAKLISQAYMNRSNEITFLGNEVNSASSKLKSVAAIAVNMNYVDGDTLLYKGMSGNTTTLVVDVPTESKAVDFVFVNCEDAAGNFYPVVKIGTQTWMAENMRTDRYNSGATIDNVTDGAVWGDADNMLTGAWVNLDNLADNDARIGKLYNWFAVTDIRGIAPAGWHVPSLDEFGVLQEFLGGIDLAGSKIKERGDANWETGTNLDATNSSGFSARAGAKCNSSGMMNDYNYCYMWTATASTENIGEAFCAYSKGNGTTLKLTYDTSYRNGFTLRCILD